MKKLLIDWISSPLLAAAVNINYDDAALSLVMAESRQRQHRQNSHEKKTKHASKTQMILQQRHEWQVRVKKLLIDRISAGKFITIKYFMWRERDKAWLMNDDKEKRRPARKDL